MTGECRFCAQNGPRWGGGGFSRGVVREQAVSRAWPARSAPVDGKASRRSKLTDLKMFGVIVSERTVNGQTRREQRLYIGSIAPDANLLMRTVRAHWEIENALHWCLDVAMNDDQMRARVKNAGANLAILRRLVLNLFRANPVKGKKVGIHTQRIIAASSPQYRDKLLGLKAV